MAVNTPRPATETANLLLDLTRQMAVSPFLDAQLQTLIDAATQVLGAERSTIFLNDPDTRELYSRVVVGGVTREIRILNGSGLAGHVFTRGEGLVVDDAYANPRFNPDIDHRTGFTTRNVLTAPIRSMRGEVIGVAQVLNKTGGDFTADDLALVTAMNTDENEARAVLSTRPTSVSRSAQARSTRSPHIALNSNRKAPVSAFSSIQQSMTPVSIISRMWGVICCATSMIGTWALLPLVRTE